MPPLRCADRLLDLSLPIGPRFDFGVVPQVYDAVALQRFEMYLETLQPLFIRMAIADKYFRRLFGQVGRMRRLAYSLVGIVLLSNLIKTAIGSSLILTHDP